jgi:hypothetical protein
LSFKEYDRFGMLFLTFADPGPASWHSSIQNMACIFIFFQDIEHNYSLNVPNQHAVYTIRHAEFS